MRILVVGSGGREHALAWKISQSPRLTKLFIAPGNGGTAEFGENVPIQADNIRALVDFCLRQAVDLVVVGPEKSLALGLVDDLQRYHIAAFGPTRLAALIEASKAFAKAFMEKHSIPTARFKTFSDYGEAASYVENAPYPVVIKASGLAGGKGVVVPESIDEAIQSLRSFMLHNDFGAAGKLVVIEERLTGNEVSILAFTDGTHLSIMPPAQDHKRLLDGGLGPNTGGMGAFAPSKICPPELLNRIRTTILQPAIDGLRQEEKSFIGVLYAGLILTREGPQVLEFNSRLGDPETQALLPLLESDLIEILRACIEGRLDTCKVEWKRKAAACVVLASEGYPGASPIGKAIYGLEIPRKDVLVFQDNTQKAGEEVISSGGRVLGVTGLGKNLAAAIRTAYLAIEGDQPVGFKGQLYRRDIGRKPAHSQATTSTPSLSRPGATPDSGSRAIELMAKDVRSTYGPEVLAGIGAFGGIYHAVKLTKMADPVLVATTDGIGNKIQLALQVGKVAGLGRDLVNHCINDVLVQGAKPLFFLDYFATARVKPELVAEVVSGIASACREAGCALLGGETAEMPGVFSRGEFDLAGTLIGVVERERMLPRPGITSGDLIVGLRSNGPHTTGFTLIRKAFSQTPLKTIYAELGEPLSQALLAEHRSYLPLLMPILERTPGMIKALAHLTGGGFIENIPRVLPPGLSASLYPGRWPVPPVFGLIQKHGKVSPEEMHRVFNMGIGMVAILSAYNLDPFLTALGEEAWVIGEVEPGERKVRLRII